jgi:uncharacterized protein YabE (DUF348 family)
MVWRFISTLVLVAGLATIVMLGDSVLAHNQDGRLISVYDRGTTRVFLSKAKTLGEALKAENIELDARDTVEPSVKEELIASGYRVNIYHARPVVVVDGTIRIKTVSSYQTAKQIAKDVGVIVYDEDITTLKLITDFVTYGVGFLDLYGKKTEIRTQAKTVGDMLIEKNITLGSKGRVSVPKKTPISQGMDVRIWREGIQTVSIDQDMPVTSRIIYDTDHPIGYRAIQTASTPGVRSITYQLNIKDGVEISRVEIANIITRNPTEQIEVIGLRNDGAGLTKTKSAQFFTDSKGVSHRETYYDLNMSVVMQSCGQGGRYYVRPDGAKVDNQGYIIVAASYVSYSKCSIVETSLGLAKVYDTGGFATRFPYGFDLATDWSVADGL